MSEENKNDFIEVDVFTLEFDGEKHDYAVLDSFDLEAKSYIVVSEIDEKSDVITDDIIDEGNIEIFRYYEEDGIVESIDDDEEYDKIADYYEKICEDESEEFEIDILTLTMNDDKDHDFAIMDQFERDGKEYIVLAELDGDVIIDDITIYEYNSADDIVIYIEEDDSYNEIAEYYARLCDEAEKL